MKNYCILGTDNRSVALRQMYIEQGIKIVDYELADVIITPIPFTRDDIKINGEILECSELISSVVGKKVTLYTGALSQNMRNILEENKIKFYDLMDLDSVAILNAIPTAEGAIAAAMEMTDFTLHGSNILILGFGRIGKILAKMLYGIGANIFCEARKESDLSMIEAYGFKAVELANLDMYLPDMNIIFNTIPNLILDERRLKMLDSKCAIIDLASSPGGIDFAKAKELKINFSWALSLPSKVAPYTAAKYLKVTIDKIENEKS